MTVVIYKSFSFLCLRLQYIADITFAGKKKKKSSKEIQTLNLDYFDVTTSHKKTTAAPGFSHCSLPLALLNKSGKTN